jgi:hypothetical protein
MAAVELAQALRAGLGLDDLHAGSLEHAAQQEA